jgi:hypothetical protein
VDDYSGELGRWIDRAKTQLAPLPVHSLARRQLEVAIARMEHAYGRLQKNGPTEQERAWRQPEARSHTEESGGGHGAIEVAGYEADLGEVREALHRASFYLGHPAPDAGLREAIAEIEQALAQLKQLRGP